MVLAGRRALLLGLLGTAGLVGSATAQPPPPPGWYGNERRRRDYERWREREWRRRERGARRRHQEWRRDSWEEDEWDTTDAQAYPASLRAEPEPERYTGLLGTEQTATGTEPATLPEGLGTTDPDAAGASDGARVSTGS